MDRVIEEASRVVGSFGSDDLDFVARKLGVAVLDLLESSKQMKECYFPELNAIALRPGLLSFERRFLIAHGLGHHLLHRGESAPDFIRLHDQSPHPHDPEARSDISRVETEANLFASYLLVPDSKLRSILQRDSFLKSEDPAADLAIEFQVPPEVMQTRLVYELSRRRPGQE